MSEPILSQTQIDAFHRDGFVLVRGLISVSMAAQMSKDYDRAIGGGYDIPAWRETLGPDRAHFLVGGGLLFDRRTTFCVGSFCRHGSDEWALVPHLSFVIENLSLLAWDEWLFSRRSPKFYMRPSPHHQ